MYVLRWGDQWFSLEFRFTRGMELPGWKRGKRDWGGRMGMEKLKKEMNSIRGEAIWRCFKWRSTLEILFFFSFLLLLFFFFLLPSLPLACVALPDRSSRNAISLVQRLSFGENEDVVKHLGMIYLSLDHDAPGSTNVPPFFYLFSLSLVSVEKKFM